MISCSPTLAKGSKIVFDSSNVPGTIPDLLVLKSEIAEKRPADVQKIVNAWYESLDWWKAHPDDAQGRRIVANLVAMARQYPGSVCSCPTTTWASAAS